uniref:Glycosyltransferase n=1 Tax=viral metagenome TaxID=1070528 RepID=A0A6M3LBR9_9ZZZZ
MGDAPVLIHARADGVTGLGHAARCAHLANALARRGVSVVALALSEADDTASRHWSRVLDPAVTTLRAARGELEEVLDRVRPVGVVLDLMDCDPVLSTAVHQCGAGLVTVVGNGWSVTQQVVDLSDALLYQSCINVPGHRSGVNWLMLDHKYSWKRYRTREKSLDAVVAFGGGVDSAYTMEVCARVAAAGMTVVGIAGEHQLDPGWPTSFGAYAVLRDSHSLLGAMSKARLFVGSLGMMAYEAAAVGAIPILTGRSQEHVHTADELARRGAGVSLGLTGEVEPRFLAEAASLFLGSDAQAAMRQRGQRLIDGKGVWRVERWLRKIWNL